MILSIWKLGAEDRCNPFGEGLSPMRFDNEELHLHLPRGISYERALEIRRLVQEIIPIIKMAHFRK
jgi:hypothetical protein